MPGSIAEQESNIEICISCNAHFPNSEANPDCISCLKIASLYSKSHISKEFAVGQRKHASGEGGGVHAASRARNTASGHVTAGLSALNRGRGSALKHRHRAQPAPDIAHITFQLARAK
eukprot:3977695-Pleurochrysis_carterae.AAC.1